MPRGLWATPLPTGVLAPGLWALRDGFVNVYALAGPDGLLLVDAGWRRTRLLRELRRLGLDPVDVRGVLISHRHWDHARGVGAVPAAVVFPNAGSVPAEECRLRVAGLEVRVLPCPGHSADSLAYLIDGRWLFTGDTVWLQRGRAWANPRWFNRDQAAMHASIARLARLDGVEALLTGHSGWARGVETALGPWQDWATIR